MNFDQEAEKLLDLVYQFNQTKNKRSLNQSMGGARLIMHLLYEEKVLTPGEISEKLSISTARVATALNLLEEKMLIKRTIDVKDRRKIIVQLTKKGNEKTQILKNHILSKTSQLLSQLGTKDTEELLRITTKVFNIIIELQQKENQQDV